MFRTLSENAHIICWIFASLIFLCISGYFLLGLILKKQEMSLKGLLIGEEHLFAALSSIVIFLSFSFKIALVIWIFTYLIMCFLFRNNHRIIRYINDLEKNILHKSTSTKQIISLSQTIPYVSSARITLWVKDFWALRKEVLNKIDRDAHTNPSKFKFNLSPFFSFPNRNNWCIYGTANIRESCR